MDHYSLRWNNYLNQITGAFDSLKNEEDFVDVTLSCEGKKIKAHKILLSACSPYFREIFKDNPCQHPIIVFRNFKHEDLQAIIDFMYKGEVDVKQENFESFLGAAELLEVKGLTEGSRTNFEEEDSDSVKINASTSAAFDPLASPTTGPANSRTRKRKNSKTANKTSPLDKKQKSTLPDTPVIPKIEKTDFEVEDLTFEEEDTDDSQSTSTDLSASHSKDFEPLTKGGARGPSSSGEMLPEMKTQTDLKENAAEGTIGKNIVNKDKQLGIKKESHLPKQPIVEEKKPEVLLTKCRKPFEKETTSHTRCGGGINDRIIKQTAIQTPLIQKSINLPKDLVVTAKNDVIGTNQSEEELAILRSEEAKTPSQEEYSNVQEQNVDMCEVASLGEAETAEDPPEMTSNELNNEADQDEEEQVEPEFDYFGCEICKADARPVDKDNLVLSHKCPICPCTCFCAHLLKDHMKVIHGWFNVQRRFTHY